MVAMKAKRQHSKTFNKVENEAVAIDEAMGRLNNATAIFEKSNTQVALEVGAILATAQAKLSKYGEGVFIRWIQERLRLRLKKTTAYKWLRLHERLGDCPQCVQTIDVSALYILTQDSGPAYSGALKDSLALAEKGKRVTRQTVIRILQAYRDEAVLDGWDDDGIPEVPGDLTTVQQLKKIWSRATVDEQREFKRWETRRRLSRKQRSLRRKAKTTTTLNNG